VESGFLGGKGSAVANWHSCRQNGEKSRLGGQLQKLLASMGAAVAAKIGTACISLFLYFACSSTPI
jgi:hypothetical protein